MLIFLYEQTQIEKLNKKVFPDNNLGISQTNNNLSFNSQAIWLDYTDPVDVATLTIVNPSNTDS